MYLHLCRGQVEPKWLGEGHSFWQLVTMVEVKLLAFASVSAQVACSGEVAQSNIYILEESHSLKGTFT